jgi:hypothetical protein
MLFFFVMRLLLPAFAALLLFSGCGPDTKEQFWSRFNALMDEEQGRSTAVFQSSPESRAEQMDKFVLEYYEDFAATMTQEEKAEFFGKVAMFYLTRSGVLPRAEVAPQASDTIKINITPALRAVGKVFQEMGKALADSARAYNAELHEQQAQADSIKKK